MEKNRNTEIEEQSEDLRIEDLERELAEARDVVLRRTAEMENMRRRHQQERAQLIFEANKRLMTDLLPTIDDMERMLAHLKPETDSSLAQGLELVYKNFLKVLEQYGVRTIDAVGKPFDVALHDALMEEESAEVEAGTVLREIVKGYMINDSVLRHAKVIVAK